MLHRLSLLIAFMACPVLAEDAPLLAEYNANSGSLPPEYAWNVAVSILADGTLALKRCPGYETDGPACKTRTAKLATEALEAIRTTVADSDLVRIPASEAAAEDIPVGGGTTGGAVYLDGQKIALPAFPIEADAPRVSTVLAALHAAIPARLGKRFIEGN